MGQAWGCFVFGCAVSLTLGLAESGYAQSNTFPTSGDVGIGTTTPAYLLDVKGSMRATSLVTGTNSISLTNGLLSGLGRGSSVNYNNVPSATAGPGGARWVDGSGDSNGPISGGNSSGHLLQFDPLWSSLPDAFKLQFAAPYDGNMYWREQYNGTWAGWNQLVQINPAGNVGLGTASPMGNLDVENGSNTAKICLNGSCVSSLSGGTGSSLNSFSDVGRGGGFNYNTLLSATAGAAADRWVDGGGNSNGPISAGNSSGHLLQFDPLWNSQPDGFKIQFAVPYDGNMYWREQYNGTWAGWSQLIVANSSGNVGIGMTAPATTLDVNGGIRAGSSTVVTTCNSSLEGTQRYNYTSHGMEYCNGTSWMSVGATVASGTWCGYYDSLASNLVSACSGSNPSSGCPTGYNQVVIQASGGSTAGYTCIHN